MPEGVDIEYHLYLAVWIFVPLVMFAVHGRGGRMTGVLVYSYYVAFFMAHWMGAFVHASPWHEFVDSTDTIVGFRLSTYALLAFAAGALVVGGPPARAEHSHPWQAQQHAVRAFDDVATVYLAAGAFFWALSLTSVGSLPGAGAVLGAGRLCAVYGIGLHCWAAWRRRDWGRLRIWLAVAVVFPVVTVLTQGFIGYGVAMLAMIVVFVAMFYRPRWRLAAGFAVGVYAGMSLWVAYSSHRNAIREAVWGEQSLDARIAAVWEAAQSLAPFDFSNARHLELIDERLNQNHLVGAAVRVTPALVPFAHGETLYSAMLAIIPRAVWPDKPVVGGSGQYVSRHTMLEFGAGTSVGMGQVLELYVNFGSTCVLVGLFALGAMLRRMDVRFVDALQRGDVRTAQLSFLIGVGALQAGGSLSEIVASMGGGAVLSFVLTRMIDWQLARRVRRYPSGGFR